MSDAPAEILFESDDLRATLRLAGAGAGAARPLVVTFDSLNHDLSLDRAGFGQDWLAACGLDAVHIVSRHNRWYQYPEMAALFAAVRAKASAHPRAVTYGSSMGGYAAVRFAGRMGAEAAIAISPQFSIDPARASFDDRWRENAREVEFLWEEPSAEDAGLKAAHIFYDPKDPDRRHVEALARLYPVSPLPLRHAGHPAGAYLAEGGLLGSVVLALIEDRFEAADFPRQVRSVRRLSGQYHFTLALRQPMHRPRTALRLAVEAARLGPLSAPYLSLHARWLDLARQPEEAERLHRRAVELEPGHVRFHLELAQHLQRRGRDDEARAALAELDRVDPARGWIGPAACELLFLLGDDAGALEAARAAKGAEIVGARRMAAAAAALAALRSTPGVGAWLLERGRRRLRRARALRRARLSLRLFPAGGAGA